MESDIASTLDFREVEREAGVDGLELEPGSSLPFRICDIVFGLLLSVVFLAYAQDSYSS